jgi:hypothetical protein
VQNGALGFEKKNMQHLKNNVCVPNDDYVVSVGFQRTNRKVGKIVSLHQRELFKKIPGLDTFCTQSANEGLIKIFHWKYCYIC